ncbi:MAG: ABC transporter permease [Halobacteriovoraceae bacterium]|nr:ABC transporter permease [Halobacteriovoraceae bacterium]
MNITSYVARRLFYVIPVLLGVCFLVFLIFNVVSPDPTISMLGKHATKSQVIELRESLGLNKPLWVQYLDIVKSAFTFDFGRSWSTKQEIFEMIKQGAVPSLTVTFPAFFLSFIISVSISLFVAFYRGSMLDKGAVFICVALMSISSLVYILVGQWFFAYKLGLFEISGYEEGFPNFVPYVMLPIIIWIILGVGPDVRFYRTIMLDEMYQDYVRTARSKGLNEKVIMFKHVLKNAMVSIITYVVLRIPFLILGSLLIESFFGIPGLGGITLKAVNSSDFPVIKAMAVLSAIATIVFNVITDVLYVVVDPRVKLN